ncbi:MAG TPA: hypothetical protein VHH73_03585, partial [Verrucomicrobiae bacterium]|nr:hypothetical protein [Verrucomicrobiae bacterium]
MSAFLYSIRHRLSCVTAVLWLVGCFEGRAYGAASLALTRADYIDRVQAVWTAQICAVLLAWPHEHQVSSTLWLTNFPKPYTVAPVDDDWYYEMCAIRAFEKHGPNLTV